MRSARILAVVAASVISVTALAGCSSSDPKSCDRRDPQHLGLVYGATANSMAPKLTTEATTLLDKAASSNGSVTVVTPSGKPKITGPIPMGSQANDDSICTDDHANAISAVNVVLKKSIASGKEVDYLGAIADAASVDSGKSLGVVVVGSGLQTSGLLDFTKNDLLYGDADRIADEMAKQNALPAALKGLTISWSGMGDVAAPQAQLPESAKKNLEAIWTAVIAKGGGTLTVLPEPLTDAPKAGLPTVTPVQVRAAALKLDWRAPVTLSDDQLHFQGDSAELVDAAAAKSLLAKVATSVIDRGIRLTVTGATSAQGGASQAHDLLLSKQRAATVKRLLVGLHVPSSSIRTAGVGHSWCGFKREVATDGKTVAQIAAGNRRVVLTAAGVQLCSKS